MTLEEWEVVRFYLVLFAGVFTVSSLAISAYISMQKPGIQTSI